MIVWIGLILLILFLYFVGTTSKWRRRNENSSRDKVK